MRRLKKQKESLAVGADEFADLMAPFLPWIEGCGEIAVAVSGGGDSLALVLLLAQWSEMRAGPDILAVTVDHGLRPESGAEARQVAGWMQKFSCVTHAILEWRGAKPRTGLAEAAREKRYALLKGFCRKKGIHHLFVAHHQDDQAETVLMRLCAGSGVDGLSGMRGVEVIPDFASSPSSGCTSGPARKLRRESIETQPDCCKRNRRRCGEDILVLRPLLSISHERLIATLRAAEQKWIEDPTNKNDKYVRPRLRLARDVLAAEGLSAKRLSVLSARMGRAQRALEHMTDAYWQQINIGKGQITFATDLWAKMPDEIRVRMMIRAMAHRAPRQPRLEQIESMVKKLSGDSDGIRRVTLAGCVITRGQKWVKIIKETGR